MAGVTVLLQESLLRIARDARPPRPRIRCVACSECARSAASVNPRRPRVHVRAGQRGADAQIRIVAFRVHHLNCVSSCPLGGALMDGHSLSARGRLACHCLLIETHAGLVLVDTGFGLRDVESPRARLSALFRVLVSPDLREQMTAIRQIQRMGFNPDDVRHIVLTHLDFDHAGGLDDFPRARVHMLERERAAATAQSTFLDRARYRPQQWSTQANWRTYEPNEGADWFGFSCVRELDDLAPDILLVPLIGHTHGHAGVAVRTREGWQLLAGDAYFDGREMNLDRPRCTPGLRFYQWMLEKNRRARLGNQQRLRELKRARLDHADLVLFSSHDPRELERLAGHGLDTPANDLRTHANAGAGEGLSAPHV
jgi:glyoxylase-like metal-dependent hydrolase (beta-lactamase superfamily II)